MENEEINKFILCECSYEILMVSKDDDVVNFSIFSKGNYNNKPNIFQRLKYCWYHLTTGEQYEYHIVLSKQKSIELSEWLLNNTK